MSQLATQLAAALNEQRLVNGLVAHVLHRIIPAAGTRHPLDTVDLRLANPGRERRERLTATWPKADLLAVGEGEPP